MLAVALLLAVPSRANQPISATDLVHDAFRLPKDLFYAALIPSGARFCDQAAGRRQARAFDQRFGKRVNALASAITARDGLGWADDDVITTDCVGFDADPPLDQLLDSFERRLRDLERRYGLRQAKR